MIPTVETERLRLRPPTRDDARAMFGVMSGADVLKYFPVGGELTVDRVTKRIQGQLDHWAEHDYGIWVLEAKSDGSLLGNCGLQILPKAGAPEIDFLLGRNAWGKGYATEAAKAAMRWGFETPNFDLIVGIVHIENHASRHVLRKLGMKLIGEEPWFGMPCEYYELQKGTFDG